MTIRWKYFLGSLALIAVTVWFAVLAYPEPKLHLIACDVGQGDALLAIYGTTQILVDGGPNNRVLECLSRYVPFWDRDIEVVILTHPQVDHFNGLIEVFKRYDVQVFLATPVDSSTQAYQVLKKVVGGSGAKVVNPTTGMVVRFGLLYLDILHPSEQFVLSNAEGSVSKSVLGAIDTKRDLNEYSVVVNLRLGEFDALLTGDIGPKVSNKIVEELVLSGSRRIEYIKIPHHGSKNGLTEELLEVSRPEVGVISAGKNNRYGHPHDEVIKLLSEREIKILRTDLDGDVEIITDGNRWWVE